MPVPTPLLSPIRRTARLLLPALAAATLWIPAVGTAGILQQISPSATSYTFDVDFRPMLWSGTGDVTALVQSVDLQLGVGNTNTSGCEAADFAGFLVGNIALIQRGACAFKDKAQNAVAAGAAGVLIFNQGNASDGSRDVLFFGTLQDDLWGDIPVVSLTYTLGAAFAATPGLLMRLEVNKDDPIRPAPVPTPATLPLLAAALVAYAATRRRKQ